jgi:hypothetical protein
MMIKILTIIFLVLIPKLGSPPLVRSGPSRIPRVKKAREAFFRQAVFVERGIRDRNLFDGDMATGFWPSRKYGSDRRVEGGCFRLDLGEVTDVHRIVLRVPDEYSLQPLLNDEGNYVEVSTDLRTWEYVNARRDKNYTYYAPVTTDMIDKPIDVYVLAYDKEKNDIKPMVWVSAYPVPFENKFLRLYSRLRLERMGRGKLFTIDN